MSARIADFAWAKTIKAINAEAAASGRIAWQTIGQVDLPIIVEAMEAGDERAEKHFLATTAALQEIERRTKKRASTCACCKTTLPTLFTDFDLVFLTADTPFATQAIWYSVCKACGPTPDEMGVRAQELIRRIWSAK